MLIYDLIVGMEKLETAQPHTCALGQSVNDQQILGSNSIEGKVAKRCQKDISHGLFFLCCLFGAPECFQFYEAVQSFKMFKAALDQKIIIKTYQYRLQLSTVSPPWSAWTYKLGCRAVVAWRLLVRRPKLSLPQEAGDCHWVSNCAILRPTRYFPCMCNAWSHETNLNKVQSLSLIAW